MSLSEHDRRAIAQAIAEELRQCSWPCGMKPEVVADILEMRELFNTGRRGMARAVWQLLKAGLLFILVLGLLSRALKLEAVGELLRKMQ